MPNFDESVIHEVVRIFRDIIGDEDAEIDVETDISALELSEEDYVEVITEVECEFGIDVDEESIETIGDLIKIAMEEGIY